MVTNSDKKFSELSKIETTSLQIQTALLQIKLHHCSLALLRRSLDLKRCGLDLSQWGKIFSNLWISMYTYMYMLGSFCIIYSNGVVNSFKDKNYHNSTQSSSISYFLSERVLICSSAASICQSAVSVFLGPRSKVRAKRIERQFHVNRLDFLLGL